MLLTDPQSLSSALACKDIHGRFTRWINFLAENNIDFHYRKGTTKKAEYFLSRNMMEAWKDNPDRSELMRLLVLDLNKETLF